MVVLEPGRVCIKLVGKEKGKYCVVLKKIDKNFVEITGPKSLTGVKHRRCNLIHLKPTQYIIEIKEGATDEEIIAAYEKAGLIKKFGLKKPSAAELKSKEVSKGKGKRS